MVNRSEETAWPRGMALCVLLAVLPLCCAVGIEHRVVNRQCLSDESTCYVLYEANKEVITWQQAVKYCKDKHYHLAIIPDHVTQGAISALNKPSELKGDGHAWVAGRRSDDTSWYDVTGQIYPGRIYETYKSSQTKCVQLYQHNSTRVWSRLEAQPCYSLSSTLTRALCQYTLTSDSAQCEGYTESGICYVPSPSYLRTWYDARMYCMTSYPDGDLAYRLLSSDSLRDYFWNHLSSIPRISRNLWVGVERNPWKWVKDNVESPVVYSVWYPEEGAGLDEDCMLVDLNANSSWADKACNYTSTYFICQYKTGVDEVTVGITTSQPHTMATDYDVTTESGDVKGNIGLAAIIITCVILGLLVIALLVGLVTCFLRDRKKWSKSLLLRFLAYGRGFDKSREVANKSRDRKEIIAADMQDGRSIDESRLSDSASIGRANVTLPQERAQPVMASGSAPDREAMASGRGENEEPRYIVMSGMMAQARRDHRNGFPDQRDNKHCVTFKDPEYVECMPIVNANSQSVLNSADLSMERRPISGLDDVTDPMYVVKITLPQQDIVFHTLDHYLPSSADRHTVGGDVSGSKQNPAYTEVKKPRSRSEDVEARIRQHVTELPESERSGHPARSRPSAAVDRPN